MFTIGSKIMKLIVSGWSAIIFLQSVFDHVWLPPGMEMTDFSHEIEPQPVRKWSTLSVILDFPTTVNFIYILEHSQLLKVLISNNPLD